jgi:hypothetical protein
VWRNGGTGPEQISVEPMSFAVGATDGSVIMQRKSGYSPDWTEADTIPLVVRDGVVQELFPAIHWAPDSWIRVHDVAQVDGHPTVLYEIAHDLSLNVSGSGSLVATQIDTGATTVVVAEFGGWEQGSSRMHLSETGLVIGEEFAEVDRSFASYRLDGSPGLTAKDLGLEPGYVDCSDCPLLYAISTDGGTIAWIQGTTLVLWDVAAKAERERIEIGDNAASARDLDIGDGYAVLDRYSFEGGTQTTPGVTSAAPPLIVEFGNGTVTTRDARGTSGSVFSAQTTQPVVSLDEVAQAGPKGVKLGDRAITDTPTDLAVPAPDGDVYMQPTGGNTITIWRAATGMIDDMFAAVKLIGTPTLHDVNSVDGKLVVLYTLSSVDSSTPETTWTRLYASTVAGDLGQVGGWEYGVAGSLHLASNGLIVGEQNQLVSADLFVTGLPGAPVFTAKDVGPEDSYVDCDCPYGFTVSTDGSTIAWIDKSELIVFDLAISAEKARWPIPGEGRFAVDLGATSAVVHNFVETPGASRPRLIDLTTGAVTELDPGTTASIR